MYERLLLAPRELELRMSPLGDPESPLLLISLDDWRDEPADRVLRAAAAVSGTLRIAVGILESAPTPIVEPLLRAMTLTLSSTAAGEGRELIGCDDIAAGLDRLSSAVDRNPRASVALARLLRQTVTSDVEAGLAAEAAVYSMLLGGNEFARWRTEHSVRPMVSSKRPLVRVDRTGDRLAVVLDNPGRRNALSMRMRESLLEAFQLAELDPSIAQVELRGAGPAFCSGGDLDEFGVATDLVAAYLVRLERAPWRIIDRLRDRFTARVHGACIGAGIEMAAFAGRLIADSDTFFQLPEIGMGLVPGAGGTVSVVRRTGRWRAAWMMLTGERLDVETALRWGLVDQIDS
ncbi:enoyl-CoA hydratase/isomerase family protein [Nocardia sp. NBC_00565]|uniref:enoyl-CoA hydratase/isomerase family protein n=1 Tax=Nocardia sp. NBC_00565 TaxID=2975993 RepID=UPI002E8190EB|nr:enoyl-CoA hydratase/isomerase family protein [Nocardia sp. NBC_00565]WUC04771.1 enoyl-CoA hydratase/isomerase family protein [Nocardia sp. NBC_00565]